MKVEYAAEALADLREAETYREQYGPAASLALIAAVRNSAMRLARFPLLGRPGREQGTRELSVPNSAYRIIYVIEDEKVVVLNIVHERRDWQGRSER